MKFKAASRNLVGKMASVISVEVNENPPKKFKGKKMNEFFFPDDYWNFIKADPSQKEMGSNSNMRDLSPFQVYSLLKDLDPEIINKMVGKRESLFLTCLPVTPNGNRVMETADKIYFDERTKGYKRLIDFRGQANELGSRVRDCLSVSKLHTEKSANPDIKSGGKLIKDVVLSKRTDHSFRMVVVGDPNINFGEIGLPWDICQAMVIAETLDILNQERLLAFCKLALLEKGELRVRRKGNLVSFRNVNALEIGDIVYRHLDEGDLVLINRPPSIHQHSLFGLSVRVLPVDSVTSLNPVCCSPLRGDFDGDCLHGYIPQAINSRVELRELVDIHSQLVNGQNGRNLLSLCHDSLSAVYLLREKGVYLNKIEMQQLGMSCQREILIQKCSLCMDLTAPPYKVAPGEWTGNQLLSMLFPKCLDYVSPSNGIHICKGEILYSTLESSWLQDTDDNIFSGLVKHYGSEALDILCCAQEVLLEWISMRGFSVSLADLYICADTNSRNKMLEEIYYGLDEAEQRLHTKQLLVDPAKGDFFRHNEDNQNFEVLKFGNICQSKGMAVLNRLSVSSFKEVFRDLQSLIFRYSIKDNSLLAMVKAGSKGSLLKLIEQGVTLGLQHSVVPLSFSIPCKISSKSGVEASDAQRYSAKSVPYAVVESSFLEGLNPGDCFMHSMANRSTSFGDNASVPGILFKNLMNYMRDLYLAYDRTVRNLNGEQVIQFTYDVSQDSSVQYSCGHEFKNTYDVNYLGSPVGSLAACSISEAAYSALDQPLSTVESSPLQNLKKLLESSQKKKIVNRTVSLFLSKKLERWLYGFEYGALKVKSHLERVHFSDVVSTVTINFSQQEICEASKEQKLSSRVPKVVPVVECVFHVCKEKMNKRGLNADSILDVLNCECDYIGDELKVNLPKLHIFYRPCSIVDAQKEPDEALCIVMISEFSGSHPKLLDTLRDSVIPHLLRTVIAGCSEVKKVDILWSDVSGSSKSEKVSTGELCLKVHICSETFKTGNCWNLLVDKCLHIMDIIDWKKSHPDSIPDIYCTYGIDGAREHFLSKLKVIVSEIGKYILPEHLVLIADCLSLTGEFVGLSAKGIATQRNLASVSSPFTQACFSNPEPCFIKAAKEGVEDSLLGALDAAAWGKEIPIGTGGKFDILYSGKGPEVSKPTDIYSLLRCHMPPKGKDVGIRVPTAHKSMPAKISTYKEKTIERMITILRDILHKRYSIDDSVSEKDKLILMQVLHFHPKSTEKMGTGIQDIKVGPHPEHPETRCFLITRNDGSVEDFSYIKCVEGARKALGLPPSPDKR
ncbi:Dna-directed rna polymerase iv subunit [Thalictrum thalictroides]|uniref:DNA-directed RNA polymerase n=1 Tax=Thalictrum thalictroides TaxID=46969 RepID=A0A7J6VIP2_THATH|nr:Dna-directed rna polymerase iv subunit [Thalictrum thalictroides]